MQDEDLNTTKGNEQQFAFLAFSVKETFEGDRGEQVTVCSRCTQVSKT